MITRMDEAMETIAPLTVCAASSEAIGNPELAAASLLTALVPIVWHAIRWRPINLQAVQW